MENSTLGILICRNYYKELNFVIKDGNYKNIITSTFDSSCAVTNSTDHENFEGRMKSLQDKTTDIKVIGGEFCTTCINKAVKSDNNITSLPVNCSDYFVSKSLLDQFISENYYIITPGWLKSWRQMVIERWGFDENTAKLFFSETAKKILVLDTGVYPEYTEKLTAFSEFIGLPHKTLHIGIEYFQMKVEKLIDRWILEQSEIDNKNVIKEKNQKLANYAMLFDIIPKIAIYTTENQIIQSVIRLLEMLFSPKEVVYASIKDGVIAEFVSSSSDTLYDKKTIGKYFDFPDDYEITENKKGLKIKVSFNDENIAYILIDNFLFPEYLNSYYQELNTITTFLGLFMINSRQHSEIIRSRDNLEKSEKKLQESNQSKDKFFSIIAHDLKGPFSTIISFSELLNNNYESFDDEKKKQFVEIIYQTLQDTFKLLENLLFWAQSQKGAISFKPRQLYLHQFCGDIIRLLEQTADKKSIEIKNEIPDHIMVEADNDMLSTVIRNLISNGLKFTPKNGKISISSVLTKEQKGSYVKVIVKDTGLGISDYTKERLFNIGENTSSPGTENERGTGLGLILCKEFVEKHGGKIWVESVVGEGSEFIFTLPAHNSQ